MWWPMGAIAKSTIVFLFHCIFQFFIHIFSSNLSYLLFFLNFFLGSVFFLCEMYRKLNFIYSENVFFVAVLYVMSFILTQRTKLNCNETEIKLKLNWN